MALQKWKVFTSLSIALLFLSFITVTSSNKGELGESLDDRYPVMVAVSSTVIPLLHLFGKPKPLKGGVTQKPRTGSGASYLSPARRMRFLEQSRRPDEPVRLITKNSKQKDFNNETY